ncbi:MAG: hypothetical protein ABI680_06585 [Chthoniobacteraceae bacterium]
MKTSVVFLGLDVHAQNITIATASGDGSEARAYGTIPNDLHALEKVFAKLRKAHPKAELNVCYEAVVGEGGGRRGPVGEGSVRADVQNGN